MTGWFERIIALLEQTQPGLAQGLRVTGLESTIEIEELMGDFLAWRAAFPLVEKFLGVGCSRPSQIDQGVQNWFNASVQRSDAFRTLCKQEVAGSSPVVSTPLSQRCPW
jgi:hypothetical protein